MNDAEVNREVERIRKTHKSAVTRAMRTANKAKQDVLRRFQGSTDDVSRAAKANALRRIEIAEEVALDRATAKKDRDLEALRQSAGQWSDIVPTRLNKPSRLASHRKTSGKASMRRRRNGDAPFLVGDRVELHPATDRWMRGDRYGEVVYVNVKKGTATVLLDKSGKRLRFRFENLMSMDRQARLEGREVGHRNNSKVKKMGVQKEKPFLAVEEGAGTLRWPNDKPLPTGLDKDGNRRFDIETRGPWGTASKVTGLAIEPTSEGFLVHGDRSLGSPKESGYQMEGTVSIGGVKRSAFTSSHLFVYRDTVTGEDTLHNFAVLYMRRASPRNNPEPRWRERLIEKVREDKQRGAITSGEYSDLIEEIQRAKSQSKAEEIVSAHRRMRAWNPGGATGKQRVFAKSEYRYRASASERRLHGGSTVTQFLVGYEGSDPSTWMRIMGYGPTPGERKTYAIKKFLGSQDDPAKEIKKINKGRSAPRSRRSNPKGFTVQLKSPVGPRVIAEVSHNFDSLQAALPKGWEPDWNNAVRTGTGGWVYPIFKRQVVQNKGRGKTRPFRRGR